MNISESISIFTIAFRDSFESDLTFIKEINGNTNH